MVIKKRKSENAPFLSTARFGPGSIMTLLLLAVAAIALYSYGLGDFALVVAGAFVLIFIVKSTEALYLSNPEEKLILGSKCFVVKRVAKGEPGIVKIFREDGRLDSELWSSESGNEILDGNIARVTGIRSIVLLVEPFEIQAEENVPEKKDSATPKDAKQSLRKTENRLMSTIELHADSSGICDWRVCHLTDALGRRASLSSLFHHQLLNREEVTDTPPGRFDFRP